MSLLITGGPFDERTLLLGLIWMVLNSFAFGYGLTALGRLFTRCQASNVRELQTKCDQVEGEITADMLNTATPSVIPLWRRILFVLIISIGGLVTAFPAGVAGYEKYFPTGKFNLFYENRDGFFAVAYVIWTGICIGALLARTAKLFAFWYLILFALLIFNFNGCVHIWERWPK